MTEMDVNHELFIFIRPTSRSDMILEHDKQISETE